MTKSDLIAKLAIKTEMTKKDSEANVNAVFDCIVEALTEGDKVQIAGFGSFEVKVRPARTCMNPATKQKIQVPETKVPAFKAAKALKDIIAK